MKRFWAGLLAWSLMLTLCAFALADETKLTVTGNGSVTVTADCVTITLGVEETAKEVSEAQNSVNTRINAIYDALLAAGLESKEIGTDRLSINAEYDYSSIRGTQKLTGYTARNTLKIQTDKLDQAGAYIDAAFDAGANTLDYIRFSARNTEEAQQQALRLAVQQARAKAETLADASELKIASVVSIEEETNAYGGYGSGAIYTNARMDSAAPEASTMVQASSLEVTATVTMEFALAEGE